MHQKTVLKSKMRNLVIFLPLSKGLKLNSYKIFLNKISKTLLNTGNNAATSAIRYWKLKEPTFAPKVTRVFFT